MNVVIGVLVRRGTCYHQHLAVVRIHLRNNVLESAERISYLSGNSLHRHCVVGISGKVNEDILAVRFRADDLPLGIIVESHLIHRVADDFTVNIYPSV